MGEACFSHIVCIQCKAVSGQLSSWILAWVGLSCLVLRPLARLVWRGAETFVWHKLAKAVPKCSGANSVRMCSFGS